MVDSLHFLVSPTYNGKDITNATVVLEYVMPCSREYRTEYLVKSDELYKNMLEYKLPLDTKLTKEPGEIEVQITMILVEMGFEGKVTQWVRKTSPTTIPIISVSAWSNVVPSDSFTALDQRIIMNEMMAQANADQIQILGVIADNLKMNKADALKQDGNTIWIEADGKQLGDPVTITCDITEGIPVVEFGESEGTPLPQEDGFEVVEF